MQKSAGESFAGAFLVRVGLPPRFASAYRDCFTVTLVPAMVSVVWRVTPVGFGATDKPTLPLPVPDAPEVIVTQVTGLLAVQLQFGAVNTCTVAVPPVPVNDRKVGITVKVQEVKPSCVMVNC